ncbi:MAG: response regulator transcription factor, partial [Clostridia bacterium]
MQKILIIEDEAKIARFLQLELEHEGYGVRTEGDGRIGLQQVMEWKPDLLILDLMLPGLSGIEVCRRIRAQETDARLPILMLTAKDDVSDKVMGLDMGADDYMTKPFAIEELLARIRVALKRSAAMAPVQQQRLTCGALIMDEISHSVSQGDMVVHLTKKEYDLLHFLMERQGQALTRDTLLDQVWGYTYDGDTNVVDV